MTQALALDPFAPLSLAEAEAAPTEVAADEEKVAPVIPVPEDAPAAHFRHAELGEPSATWTYKDEAGRRLGHVARFETPSGKQILPRTCWSLSDRTTRQFGHREELC
jgi:hypothetical protein